MKCHLKLHIDITLHYITHTHTHTHTFNGPLSRTIRVHPWAGTRKEKPIWILQKQETVGSSGISWTICKAAPHSRQITMPAPHHSVFCRPDALPAAQPTASKHCAKINNKFICHRNRSPVHKTGQNFTNTYIVNDLLQSINLTKSNRPKVKPLSVGFRS